MGDFDRILKENIEAVFFPLLEKILDISIEKTYQIKDKIYLTIERETPFTQTFQKRSFYPFLWILKM